MSNSSPIVRQALAGLSESATVIHPLNDGARRRTTSLGDPAGLRGIGVHLNIIAPGDASTEQHTHVRAEEFIYILSGRGALLLDDERHEVVAGDFIGFPVNGPAHAMLNDGGEDLVYLVGGSRPDFDVADYPRLGKRLYIYEGKDGRRYDLVEQEQIGAFRR
jgi:uncharacterized cupin superfamily protein